MKYRFKYLTQCREDGPAYMEDIVERMIYGDKEGEVHDWIRGHILSASSNTRWTVLIFGQDGVPSRHPEVRAFRLLATARQWGKQRLRERRKAQH